MPDDTFTHDELLDLYYSIPKQAQKVASWEWVGEDIERYAEALATMPDDADQP